MRFHFVVNPVSGRRRATVLATAVARSLEAAGHSTTTYPTAAPGDARAHVASLDEDAFDRLVVAGGDGTLREVVNGRPPPLPWPVAVLPVGTANLVSREVALRGSHEPERIARGIVAAEPWPVSLLEVLRNDGTTQWAVATVGVGLDGEIVHRVSEVRARAAEPGTGGYRQWIGPLWDAFRGYRFPVVEATVDGARTHYGAAVIAQSARSYGGLFSLAPRAALDSGSIHVVVIRSRSRRDLLRLLLGAWRGRLADYHDLAFHSAQEVAIRAAVPVAVQADGDPAGTTDLTVRLRPRGLTLLRAR